ncbi:hypothetical protein GYA37_03470 [candidate division WWE3 bacterium]|uniref:N-acetyltransferase domain-containing protein n=1 Tax=candidate division WWE3 bacterium TaxID=2053526 RepID=A0A7X9E7E3_UNCKA|nr:hypothetical protein [candidate division WWE3 bacterium]
MKIHRVNFDVEAVEALSLEFFPEQQRDDFLRNVRNLLCVSGSELCKDKLLGRGADLYTIRDNNVLVGVLLNKFYVWDIIEPQLFFHLHCEDCSFISLASFGSFFPSCNQRNIVGELAYYMVKPQFRGNGFGEQLFKFSLEEFKRLLGKNDVFFTLAMGCFCGQSTGPSLQKYLLDLEEKENGLKPNGEVIIRGMPVETSKILSRFDLSLDSLVPAEKAMATLKLSEKYGLLFKGYSKNLSLLFVGKI